MCWSVAAQWVVSVQKDSSQLGFILCFQSINPWYLTSSNPHYIVQVKSI